MLSSEFGRVTRVALCHGQGMTGQAFVTMASADEARLMAARADRTMFLGKPLSLAMALANSKD